jgi:F420H(2)-dependent quinone reductase
VRECVSAPVRPSATSSGRDLRDWAAAPRTLVYVESLRAWPDAWAKESVCYLTTRGRRTRRAHRIEIWFAVESGRLFLLSGGRDSSDWVRNLLRDPRVSVDLGGSEHAGRAHLPAPGSADDALARRLLFEKYSPQEDGLEDWSRTSLAVVIDFTSAA